MIETARLILRPPTPADHAALFAMWGDPLVTFDLGGPKDQAACLAVLERHRGYAPLGFVGALWLAAAIALSGWASRARRTLA